MVKRVSLNNEVYEINDRDFERIFLNVSEIFKYLTKKEHEKVSAKIRKYGKVIYELDYMVRDD